MIQTKGLTHINLIVGDLERSLRFYQSVFGMEERFRVGSKVVFLNTPRSEDLIRDKNLVVDSFPSPSQRAKSIGTIASRSGCITIWCT